MLSLTTQRSITSETSDYWMTEVRKPEIIQIAKGKEIGHKLADLVDEKTTALLTVKYLTKHQHDLQDQKRSRSMGDMWLQDNGIYNPINVKTGIVGAEGQPNLVSLKKVLGAIMAQQIDSYYLLIVKMEIRPEEIAPSAYLIDMLDWMDYVTFDSGPGQMMLKAVKFFAEYSPERQPTLGIRDKVKKLMNLYEDGERRLKENREHDLDRYRLEFSRFMAGGDFAVTLETQRSLRLL
jgi:hypothetical protein